MSVGSVKAPKKAWLVWDGHPDSAVDADVHYGLMIKIRCPGGPRIHNMHTHTADTCVWS